MEGTVTISVEDYNEFKRYEDFYRAERTIIYQNCCTGKTYFGKAEPSEVIQELKKELEEEEKRWNLERAEVNKQRDELVRLRAELRHVRSLLEFEQNKTLLQKLFGS